MADYLRQPLYSISGGELSTDVTEVENRLNEIFKLTKRWDAVTLLDEADVLLCKRNSADMDRNAIVGGKQPRPLSRIEWSEHWRSRLANENDTNSVPANDRVFPGSSVSDDQSQG